MTEPNYLSAFWTPALVSETHGLIRASQHGREAIRAAYAALGEDTRITLTETIARARLPMLATSAFVVPVLSEAGCRAIIDRSASYAYTPNESEAPEHRINEAVLSEVDPDYDRLMQSVLMTGLAPWMMMIWGRLPSFLASIQIADYTSDGTRETALHVDRDSQYTAVISLNPGEFQGGGTAIADGLVGDYNIPPLPAGHALVMDGARTLHRGLPVVGNRKLLVVWANQKNDTW